MKLFLDVCAIIYWVEMAEPHYNKFANKLNKIKKKYKKPSFAASQLSLLECRVKPLREKNDELLSAYQQFFCAKDLLLLPMNPEVIETAAELRAFYQLRTPDALQAASALSIADKDEIIFVTNDASFKKISDLDVLLIN